MADFENILLAVDFSKNSEFLITRTMELANKYRARVFLIHAVVDLRGHLLERVFMSSLSDDVEEQMIESAKKQLRELAARLEVPESDCLIEVGSPKTGILKAAREYDIDLIVLGSHGMGGVDMLLGSTAYTILHKSPVDVFVVRLPKDTPAIEA
jgi:universal stress protein A